MKTQQNYALASESAHSCAQTKNSKKVEEKIAKKSREVPTVP